MGLTNAVDRLDNTTRALYEPEIALEDIEGVDLASIFREAAEAVAPMVRSMLSTNLSASGLKSRTGKLAAAVANVNVTATKSGNLRISMPAGIGPYEGGSSFYTAASSLNYGAIRNKLSRTSKTTIKKLAFNKTVSAKKKASAQKQLEKKNLKIGDIKISKPYGFFQLSDNQVNVVMSVYRAEVTKKIKGEE